MDERTSETTSNKGDSQNMLVDHLFQYRVSPLPKKAKKRDFCTTSFDPSRGRFKDFSL